MLKETKTLAVALVIAVTVGAGAANVFGQSTDNSANSLVGVWESVSPVGVDCETREPLGPTIRALYTFNLGGTMNVEDTLDLEGPFRTTGGGVWQRDSKRTYKWLKMHYSFIPNTTTYHGTIRAKGTLTVSQNGDSFIQTGTFDFLDPNTQTPIFSGCFEETAYRIKL